ncbi:MAG: hypothetical protein K8H88_16260 [Sandaracinaceae bacterium]|nr:hypothetical protein [Sandaracinaceae bacterium]
MRALTSILSVTPWLLACQPSCPTDDAGPRDAGVDSAIEDAQIDAGPGVDAGTDAGTDAGMPDGGPVPAIEHAGLWRFMSFSTFDPDTGVTTTLTRDGTPDAIRGDAIVAAIGVDSTLLDVRIGLLRDGVLTGPVLTQHQMVGIEGERWAIRTQDGNTDVFTFSRAGEMATLTYDETDPRNEVTQSHPSEIVLERVPQTNLLFGDWELVSLTYSGGGMTVAGACEASSTPGEWTRLRQLIVVDTRDVLRQQTTRELFSDDTCTTLIGTQSQGGGGMAEDDGARTTFYVRSDTGTSTTVTFDVAFAGTDATLTRVSCLPLPGCEASQPTSVVIHRRRL